KATIRNSTFLGNVADYDGGALEASYGTVSVEHCVFIRNQPGTFDGGVLTILPGAEATMSYCTMLGVEGWWHDRAIEVFGGASLAVDHTILAFGHQEAIYCNYGAPARLSVSCSDFFGNAQGDWKGCVAGMAVGNLSADPLFCDIVGGDFSLQANS